MGHVCSAQSERGTASTAQLVDWNGVFYRDDVLRPEAMRSATYFAVEVLRNVHPATLHGFTTEQESVILELQRFIEVGRPFFDFWLALNALFVSFHDAHTGLAYPGGFLNLPLRWVTNGLLVTSESPGLLPGDRVVSVGGADCDQLFDIIASDYVSAETDAWVRDQASRVLFSTFFLAYNSLVNQDSTVSVGVERPDGTTAEVTFPIHALGEPYSTAWPGQGIFYPEANLAVYRFDQFLPTPLFTTAVDEFFDEVDLAGITRIAIDLRNNRGGDSRAMEAFTRHLPDRPLEVYPTFVRTAATRPSDFSGHADTTAAPPDDPVLMSTQILFGPVDTTEVFRGNVFVLVSSATCSSAGMMARILRDAGIATLVGEEVGNAPPAYGDIRRFQTCISGIDFTVSTKYFFGTGPAVAMHVTPDIVTRLTVSDILQSIDPEVQFLLSE